MGTCSTPGVTRASMCWDNARVIWEMQIVGLVSGVLQNMLRISVNTPFPRKFIFRIVTSVTTFTPMEFPLLLLLPQNSTWVICNVPTGNYLIK
ncbi:hypothetical protein DEO72_LG3g994 [Vigna unguiculata]|uniref:Uncharacterized protein n=1 Tax=Vigna unguiculata TaxID=3917 RepID=A0A4D6LCZ2_VIGUN|nr:hypothetical protein DEO72_LG3g994 [Vigna unguiculata]